MQLAILRRVELGFCEGNGGVGDVSGLVSWSWRGGEGCWVLGEFLGWIWKDFAGAGGSGFKGKEEEEECRILAEGRRRNC